MLILLPPSEGKTSAATGDPVDLSSLWLPGLATPRKRVLSRLVALSRRTSARAVAESLAVLGITAGQAAELGRNAGLLTSATAPAASIYSGVLYEALDAHSLASPAREWLDARAVVFSGLWGVVRLDDRIPAYRLSVGVSLPTLGGLTAFWKKALPKALDPVAAGGPVLDLRSGAYGAMWTPPATTSATVRVLHERVVDGVPRRAVVSHFNKATKGRIVRSLAEAGAAPASVDEIVTALRDLKYTVEEQPASAGRPRQLDVVVAEL
ncbi:peroxide stress protein YaaA [Actinoplanes bogorensis]|uniref:Peroxide stress protein YaaA n=1 Tax=Paractinoplanes bogorensis TaxID=1610840 RepID=A0ABS5Z0M2_9ACTN|nr:peroxide stress protein YaaA [Actinoplanes bogorensis]MBU2669232.1 peroxide stress protein YaaA [Actinoplanes bogorensis]